MISFLTPQALHGRSAKGQLDLSLNIEIQRLTPSTPRTPLIPALRSGQQLFQEPSAKSKFLSALILFCAALPASAQQPPQISAKIKEIQMEARQTDPIGIFDKFSIFGFILPQDLDELEDKKLENSADGPQTTDLEAMDKAVDKDMNAYEDKVNFLLKTGKSIVTGAVRKYPEIVPTIADGGPQLPRGKSGGIMFFLKEGIVDGKRLMLVQIRVSGFLSIENQPDMLSFDVYFRQTPVKNLGGVQGACEKLLKQFYGDYTATRSARVTK